MWREECDGLDGIERVFDFFEATAEPALRLYYITDYRWILPGFITVWIHTDACICMWIMICKDTGRDT